MTIARVQDAAFDHDTTVGGGWTVALGSTPITGNVLVAVVAAIGTSVTFTAPSGWTLLLAETSNTNVNLSVYTKVAASESSGSYTWTPSIGVRGFAWVGEYSGVATSTPIDASAHGLASSSTTASASVTVATANAWTITAGMGRHAAAGAAKTISDGDASDSARHQHGSNNGTGNDYTAAVFDSNRALSTGADGNTLTSTVSESQLAWAEIALRSAALIPVGRIYVAALALPAPVSLRARVYASGFTLPGPSGGKTARVYASRLLISAPAGAPGPSGIYVWHGGAWRQAQVYVFRDGAWQ